MTINDAMRTYRLPNPTTPEDPRDALEQGAALRGQDPDGGLPLQREGRALLLPGRLRVPDRRHQLRGSHRTQLGKRDRLPRRRPRHPLGDEQRRVTTP